MLSFLLSLPRIAGMALFVPFFRASAVTGIVRNSIIMVLALVIFPLSHASLSETSFSGMQFLILIIKEALLGAFAGFIVSIGFFVPQAIGDFIDNQRGAAVASLFNPSIGDQAAIMGILFSQAFFAWFILSGGLLVLISAIFHSYSLWPIASFYPVFSEEALQAFLALVGDFLHLIALLSAPVIFAMLMTEFGLGLVGRFAQQLNVFFLAMPLKSITALIMILLYFQFLMPLIQEQEIITNPFKIFHSFRP